MSSGSINNVNDFFSSHYLAAVLDKDVKGIEKRWGQNTESPDKRLFKLKKHYLDLSRTQDENDVQLLNFYERLSEALGYQYEDSGRLIFLEQNQSFTLRSVLGYGDLPHLGIIYAKDEGQGILAAQPLNATPLPESEAPFDGDLEELVTKIFQDTAPPRFLLAFASNTIFLTERTRWGQGRYLLFDLDQLFDLGDKRAFFIAAVLLASESLCPGDGAAPLHDTLEESSHKHAHGVSKDLKYGLREAVEILGNAYVNYHRKHIKTKLFENDELANELTRECLRYLYRLLFLFYAEAHPELGVVPIKSEAYRTGYSLERLRDFEQAELYSEEARHGHHIHQSLNKLFKLIFSGYPTGPTNLSLSVESAALDTSFTIRALTSELFDPEQTPMLNKVKFSNATLRDVLELLSLSRAGGSRKSRGRISYATLGINQLGAVYEALLSYSGFFAQEVLYELKPKDETRNESDLFSQVYFAPESTLKDEHGNNKFDEDEFATVTEFEGEDKIRRKKKYPKGHFIYRLAGRDRERSASYYTPEVLTRCVVKYALEKRQKSINEAAPHKERAHEILELRVLEPAMGSGAFLNEAINQLATNYLERRQTELATIAERAGTKFKRLSPAEYSTELQKAKAHLAHNCCFGVDLNDTAVELAKVSLWLNILGPDTPVPRFDLQFRNGNSLWGAKRAVFDRTQLAKGRKNENFLSAVPKRHSFTDSRSNIGEYDSVGGELPSDCVFHFLLPAKSMVATAFDTTAKKIAPAECKQQARWHKDFVKGDFTEEQIGRLVVLTSKLDQLWSRHSMALKLQRESTRADFDVYGYNAERKQVAPSPTAPKSQVYRQLKLIMDMWCALFSWPLNATDKLPTRDDYLNVIEELLNNGQRHGAIDALAKRYKFVDTARQQAEHEKFCHWELEFADVFAESGGFDLIVGNPPWRNCEWRESDLLADFEPTLALRDFSSAEIASKRANILEAGNRKGEYLESLVSVLGERAFIREPQMFPLLAGTHTNSYKCFISQAWEVGAPDGCVGLLHQPALLDEPKGTKLRTALYERADLICLFRNGLSLFADVGSILRFCFSISTVKRRSTSFRYIANLKHPKTVAASLDSAGGGLIPGIKDAHGKWELRGHAARVLAVDNHTLRTFSALYDKEGAPSEGARLPIVHDVSSLKVLERFTKHQRINDRKDWHATLHWCENGGQKDGTIEKRESSPTTADELIFLGPHIYVARPFNKSPNVGCKSKQDYSVVDLTETRTDYLPRNRFSIVCRPDEVRARTPSFQGRPMTDYFRLAFRKMAVATNERTLMPTILPRQAHHSTAIVSVAFESNETLVDAVANHVSIVSDFFIRSTGKQNISAKVFGSLPDIRTNPAQRVRALGLNCLTKHYAPLWEELYDSEFANDAFTKEDPRLPPFNKLSKTWTRNTPWRTDYARRQALLELDVLAALALGLTLDELSTIYRVQFPVMYGYEKETYYDRRGHIVFTVNRGLSTVGLGRKEWSQVRLLEEGAKMPEHLEKNSGTAGFVAPFDKCDREADYALAFTVFKERVK